MQDIPGQTTSKIGGQLHPFAGRLPKLILSSQTPQNTPPDVALPTRGTRSCPIHQNTGNILPHQEAYTSHQTNLNWGQAPEVKGTRNEQHVKRRHQAQKVKQNEKRNTQQMKVQGKNPPDQTDEEEIGSLPEKEFR